jgi:hypothetical protein
MSGLGEPPRPKAQTSLERGGVSVHASANELPRRVSEEKQPMMVVPSAFDYGKRVAAIAQPPDVLRLRDCDSVKVSCLHGCPLTLRPEGCGAYRDA